MRAEEIRELTDDDVRARMAELEEERFRLRFRSATETLENPIRLRALRKDIARLKTVARERELAAGREGAAGAGRGPRRTKAGRAAAVAGGRKRTARRRAGARSNEAWPR
jgi:large subunit ribosomal protein L29